MTEDDIKTLKECYHLYNIVDLRTKNERNSAPDIEIPGTVYHALDSSREKMTDRQPGVQNNYSRCRARNRSTEK